jgi:hypothetical protein
MLEGEVKWHRLELIQSSPPAAEVKNVWSHISTAPMQIYGVVK